MDESVHHAPPSAPAYAGLKHCSSPASELVQHVAASANAGPQLWFLHARTQVGEASAYLLADAHSYFAKRDLRQLTLSLSLEGEWSDAAALFGAFCAEMAPEGAINTDTYVGSDLHGVTIATEALESDLGLYRTHRVQVNKIASGRAGMCGQSRYYTHARCSDLERQLFSQVLPLVHIRQSVNDREVRVPYLQKPSTTVRDLLDVYSWAVDRDLEASVSLITDAAGRAAYNRLTLERNEGLTRLALTSAHRGKSSWDMGVPRLSDEELSRFDRMLQTLCAYDLRLAPWQVSDVCDHDRVPSRGYRFGVWADDVLFPFAFIASMFRR